MWYAVETAFIDGKFFGSHCLFIDGDTSPMGHCYASIDEEPMNSCEKKYNNRIEIHTDWFESEDLAKSFRDGKITYIHYYDAYYDKSVKTTFTRFRKRKIVSIDVENGIYPYKGIYTKTMLDYKPSWCK